jgi:ATP-binding cassette subfamily F protein 3
MDIGYADAPVLRNVHQSIDPSTRIGLLGPNGAGKSSLIKTLAGSLNAISGERVSGEHLRIGYFAQHQLEALDLDASAALHLQRLSPKASEQQLRTFLGGFGFHGDRAFETIRHFSGGEKARLALSIIAWQKPNLLLLDEPTNHLDLEMRHALTVALQGFEGAVIIVSHDRHLLRNTVDEFLLVANGAVDEFKGDLNDYYQWMLDSRSNDNNQSPSSREVCEEGEGPVDKKQQRQNAAAKREKLKPLSNRLKKLDTSIAKHQLALEKIEDQLTDTELYNEQSENKARLTKLLLDQGKLSQTLELEEEEWLEISEELEELQAG